MIQQVKLSAKVPAWAVCLTKLEGKSTGSSSGEIADGDWLKAEALYGYKPKKTKKYEWDPSYLSVGDDNEGLLAFAYLWRRFGPSPWGTDPHKILVNYLLGTPMKGVVLTVSPRGCSLGIGTLVTDAIANAINAPFIRYERRWKAWFLKQGGKSKDYMNARFDEEICKQARKTLGFPRRRFKTQDWRNEKGIFRRVNQALFTAIQELLRPVFIRDVPINILGRVKENDRMHEAEPHQLSGYGVDLKPMWKSKAEDDKKYAKRFAS